MACPLFSSLISSLPLSPPFMTLQPHQPLCCLQTSFSALPGKLFLIPTLHSPAPGHPHIIGSSSSFRALPKYHLFGEAFQDHPIPYASFSKCGLHSSTWQLVKNVNSQTPHQAPTKLETLREEPSNLCFNVSPAGDWCILKVDKQYCLCVCKVCAYVCIYLTTSTSLFFITWFYLLHSCHLKSVFNFF